MATLDKSLLLEMFRKMEEIRRMDLKIAQLVKKESARNDALSVGEEAANVGAMLALNDDDSDHLTTVDTDKPLLKESI